MAQLICRNLTIGYAGKPVAGPLDFSVNAGDYLCILGENGAGKSTLLRTLLGLLPPIAGEIHWGDALSPRELGYLPQETAVQHDFPATVAEIVRSGCLGRCGLRPFYTREEKARAETAMEEMGIAALAPRSFRELSGGQRQRVLLARALCAARKALLLDEPAAGLDPDAADSLYRLLEGLRRRGVTLLVISHDLRASAAYASHILRLGKDPFFCTARDYFAGRETPLPDERRLNVAPLA